MTQDLKELLNVTTKLVDALAEAIIQENNLQRRPEPAADMFHGKLAVTPKELAAALSISPNRARELVHIKDFPAIKNGNRYVIPVQEFREWLKDNAGKVVM